MRLGFEERELSVRYCKYFGTVRRGGHSPLLVDAAFSLNLLLSHYIVWEDIVLGFSNVR